MRRILLSLVLALTVLCTPVLADVASGQCNLDGAITVGNVTYPACPISDVNDGLKTAGFPGARLDPSNNLSHTPIYANGVCKYVDARGITDATFIPYNSLTEWQAFLDNKPTGVHVAECCLARPMNQADVPVPTETCSTGWVFQALVDPSDATHTLATVGGNGDFILASGVVNDPNYPITKLPIERGDVGALLPAQASTAYVGKYHCDGTVDFSTSQSPVNTSSTTSTSSFTNLTNSNGTVVNTSSTSSTNTSTGNTVGGTATNVTKLMGFAMQCANTQWKPTSPSCFGRTTGIQTAACPNGGSGLITNAIIQQCDGTITTQEISNTCQPVCAPRTITTEDRPCPAGQEGSITVEVVKLCDSQQPVDTGSTVQGCFCNSTETVKTNTCKPPVVCVPSTDKGDQTQPCPDGKTGHIIIHTDSICVSQNGQCVCHDEATVKENTCEAVCSNSSKTITRQCPPGQTGLITVRVDTTCHTSCTCDGSQCVCSDAETVISNTCMTPPVQCTPSSHDVCTPCPSGQTGTITTTTTHVCPSNTDVVSTHNTCVPVCTPSTVTTPGQCPAGYTGTFSTTVQHICPDNRDVTTTNNNCTLIPPVVQPPEPPIVIIPIIIPDFDIDTGWDEWEDIDVGGGFDCDCSVDDLDLGGDW